MNGAAVDAAGHHRFERLPVRWRAKRQPVGTTFPDGAGATPISFSHVFDRGEADRRQVVRVVAIGKPIDMRPPPGGGHRHPEMIEGRATTDQRFSRRLVGVHDSTWIEE